MPHVQLCTPLSEDFAEEDRLRELEEDEGEPDQPDEDGWDDGSSITIVIQNVESLYISS